MKVSGPPHAPAALHLAKNLGTHWIGGCVGARACLYGFGVEINSRPCWDSKTGPSIL